MFDKNGMFIGNLKTVPISEEDAQRYKNLAQQVHDLKSLFKT